MSPMPERDTCCWTSRATRSTPRAAPVAELLDGYRELVLARRLNEQAGALVRQGRLAVYPSSHGQEACQVAARAWCWREGDWLFPTYRDTVADGHPRRRPGRGVDAAARRLALRVRPDGAPRRAAGHPAGHPAAARRRGRARGPAARARTPSSWRCAATARTSEGDFHEALNFAAVFHRARGVLRAEQRVRDLRAARPGRRPRRRCRTRASGTGCPGVRVDGNDLAALLVVLGEAVRPGPRRRAARRWSRPTPTAMQAHTNADDATRYRDRRRGRAVAASATRCCGCAPT